MVQAVAGSSPVVHPLLEALQMGTLALQCRLDWDQIGNLFEGAEVEILAGVPEDETPHLEALEACAALIARAERR